MKFVKLKASDWTYEEVVEIDTLDDLLKIVDGETYNIIVGKYRDENYKYVKEGIHYWIMVYDDWIE